MECIELRDWKLELDVDRVLLGEGADPVIIRQRRPRLLEQAEWALKEGIPLLQPAVVARKIGVKGLHHERLALEQGELTGKLPAQHLAGAEQVVLMVCTLGPQLEAVISDLIATDPLLGMALDGFGNAAIVELSQQANHYFERQAQAEGLQTSIPLSPGMIGWPVSGQGQIFSLLNPALIGVELTESQMMRPVKSVTQVLGIGIDMVQGRTCDYCSLKDTCRYQDHYAHSSG